VRHRHSLACLVEETTVLKFNMKLVLAGISVGVLGASGSMFILFTQIAAGLGLPAN
jgi:hypothetical protein